jgi:23S rRNA (guanosine2251-2'-O)-methyltransferase
MVKNVKEDQKFAQSSVFEGMTSISAIINSKKAGTNTRKINKIFIDKDKIKSKRPAIDFIKANAAEFGYDVIFTTCEAIDLLAVGSSHGGIIAECEERELSELPNDIVLENDGFYVMLDGIEDPYNFGYCLRSLYAAGVSGVILPRRNWMGTAGIVARSSAGASELMKIYIADVDDAIDTFKSNGYTVASAGIRNSLSIYETEIKKPLLLIIGGEKRGISSAVLEKSDLVLRIDYGREFRGSLSAASAAAVMAFEIMRQNIR